MKGQDGRMQMQTPAEAVHDTMSPARCRIASGYGR
jgi:hypothetical protein